MPELPKQNMTCSAYDWRGDQSIPKTVIDATQHIFEPSLDDLQIPFKCLTRKSLCPSTITKSSLNMRL